MSSTFPGSKDHVNLFKGYAILAVVSIHFIHAYINRFAYGSFPWQIMVILDQIVRFSVPAFVALSGFALARKYAASPPGFFQFLSTRAVKILPPYLIWSLVYYFVGWFFPDLGNFSRSAPIWELALLGRAQYHLYFVPLIFQLYVLFPLLFRLVRKSPWLFVLLSLIIQIYIYQGTGAPGWSDQTQYIRFTTWIYYFILGIFLGSVSLDRFISSRLAGISSLIVTLAGLTWTIVSGFYLVSQGKNLIYVTAFTRPPVLLYATGLILFSFFITRPRFFVKIGAWSYQIYLGHVLVLQLLSLIA
jgi:surface polysaccharide O-acyltransferase-like enzyme